MPTAGPKKTPTKRSANKTASKSAAKVSAKKPVATSRAKSTPPETASDAVDEQLARYRSMRDFHVTAEPAGSPDAASSKARSTQLPFCIQKHAASHLHYDFRLGWNGVLKSWAVAKGPSYVTADKRLAVQVEDHPIEYGGFEGIIPAGQYGGGTVMLWDQGTWEPQAAYPDVDEGLRKGSLKFILHGTKMQGKWALIRMGGHSGSSSSQRSSSAKPQWLLIKEHDPFERKPTDPAITDEADRSVITGRTMDQIAVNEDHVWNSKETARATPTAPAWYRQAAKPTPNVATPKPVILSGARSAQPKDPPPGQSPHSAPDRSASLPNLSNLPKEPQPGFLPPQLAQQAENPPSAAGWLHELKLDGYRIQARKSGSSARGQESQVTLLTRTGLDWTHRMPSLAREIARLPASSVTLDGEVVVLRPDGNTSFADLQAAFQNDARHPLTYVAFDLLHLNGRNPRTLPLAERKALLAPLLAAADPDTLRLSEHLEGDGLAILHHACKLHAEGIVSKRAAAKYCAGRSSDWIKCKCLHEQELVIGGFTLPGAGHTGMHGIGALILGYYDTSTPPRLIYAGRTGTGFNQKTHTLLRDKLEALAQPTTPFEKPPAEARKGARWVKPELVAQVRFATWTADNLVRQAAFLGLREDKPAAEVTRETSAPTPKSSAPKARVPHSSTASSSVSGETKHSTPNTPAPLEPHKPTTHERPQQTKNHRAATDPSAEGAPYASLGRSPRSAAHTLTCGLKARAKSAPDPHPAPTAKPQRNAPAPLEHPPIRLTHPQKILDPETDLTKQQLADYYWAVAPRMLPHVADRPLSLVRCPQGSSNQCFFQKHVNHMLPKGIGGIPIADKDGKVEPYITLNNPAADREALAGLAQMGVLEVHPWGSRNADIEHPDRLIFDLDPDESLPWSTVTQAALDVRARLKQLGLTSFLKTTGGKGLHVVVPIDPTHSWPEAKEWAHRFVLAMEKANPRLYLTKMTKSARANRIYLDYLRNERGATAVAPYSPRARSGAGISMPLAWPEITTSANKQGPYASTRPTFQVADFPAWADRLRATKDPWKEITSLHQSLP